MEYWNNSEHFKNKRNVLKYSITFSKEIYFKK